MSLAAPKGGAKARGKSPGPGGRSPRVGRKKKKNGPLPLGEQLAAGLKGSQVKPLARLSLVTERELMPFSKRDFIQVKTTKTLATC